MTKSKRSELETKAIQESIEHWTRMIKWVKKQPKNDWTSRNYMELKINESWFSDDCDLCKIYKDEYGINCKKCPLHKSGNDCDNCKSIWRKIYDSNTWKEWLYWAYRMRATLKRLIND